MAIQLDLIIPPVIVGLVIILIFRVNSFIVETSIDNRLQNDMQLFAETAATVVQEEMRLIAGDLQISGDTLSYSRVENGIQGTGIIARDQRNIQIIREMANAAADTVVIPANLSNLTFDLEFPEPSTNHAFIRIRVETESRPEHHARFRSDEQTVRAVAERRFFIRSMSLN